MALVLKRKRRAAAMRILVTDSIAQEGMDLLRTHLPDAQIDVRLDLTVEQLRAVIGQYTALIVRSETRVTSAILAVATQLKQEPIRDDAVLRQLLADPRVIATPHLGASTQEAQAQVAIDVAEQVVSFLQDSVLYAA